MLTEIDSANPEGASAGTLENICTKIIGIGGAACEIVASRDFGGLPLTKIVMDTSATDLGHITDGNVRKFLFGDAVTHGLSAGTDAKIGEHAARSSETEIREILAGTDLLFLVVALGRGAGSGAASFIAELARELGIMTVCFATSPFSLEGKVIVEQAMSSAEKIHAASNAFILVENDLISQVAGEVGVSDGFRISGSWIEKGVNACAAILFAKEAGARIDFGTFKTIFPLAGTPTLFALGYGKGETAVDDALNEVFRCPFLRTRTSTSHSDTLLIHIKAGTEPTVAVMNEISQRAIGRFGGGERVLTSHTVVPKLGDTIEISVLGAGEIRKTREKLGKKVSSPRASTSSLFSDFQNTASDDGKNPVTQGELFSEDLARGIFQGQGTRFYDGQDLDSPTYIRRQQNLQKIYEQKKRELSGRNPRLPA